VLTETGAEVDQFRVEVSGWDQEEIFFVEKSHLAWDEIVGKHISLHRYNDLPKYVPPPPPPVRVPRMRSANAASPNNSNPSGNNPSGNNSGS
jgi:hypothetical protein